jgi:hypothetical protein
MHVGVLWPKEPNHEKGFSKKKYIVLYKEFSTTRDDLEDFLQGEFSKVLLFVSIKLNHSIWR